MTEHKSIEEIAKLFHETYERLAPQYGYETRADTKEFDKDSPNGKLMIAVIAELIPHLNSRKEEDDFDYEQYEKDLEEVVKAIKNKETIYISTRDAHIITEEHYYEFMDWADSVGKPADSEVERFVKVDLSILNSRNLLERFQKWWNRNNETDGFIYLSDLDEFIESEGK